MNKRLRRVCAALACTMMLTTATGAFNATVFADSTNTNVSSATGKSYTVKGKNVNFYRQTPGNKSKKTVYFINGSDVPYMEITDLAGFLADSYKGLGNSTYSIDVKKSGDTVTLTRGKGSKCKIDFSSDTVYFPNFNEFTKLRDDQLDIELRDQPPVDDNGKPVYIKRVDKTASVRSGAPVTLDLASYSVDLVHKGDKYYMPIQTFNDVFMWRTDTYVLYNGKSLFYTDLSLDNMVDITGEPTDLGKLYYKNAKTATVSKEFAQYNYNELCFALDHLYGMKEEHGIESFDGLFTETGLKKEFLSGNSKRMDGALVKLFSLYLNDGHTFYDGSSYATGPEYIAKVMDELDVGSVSLGYNLKKIAPLKKRAEFFPDGVPGYEEIGDTAFITFDHFGYAEKDYYAEAPTKDSSDTIGIIAYSVQQILRKNSPIKNVVLDISMNGGGDSDAAIYTVAAFLGKATLSTKDVLSGAVSTVEYKADTNFDHKFDEKDYLADKGLNLYCLESSANFSSGNLVPGSFKQNRGVTVIGQRSSGGACYVSKMTTASGSFITISDPLTEVAMMNGSYYNVDRGVEPDIYLSKLDSYYDRKDLVEFIHGLK